MSRTRIALTGALVVAVAGAGLLAMDRGAVPGRGEIIQGTEVVTTLVASRSQKVTAQVLTAIAQPGLEPAPADEAGAVITVSVKPGRKDQPVQLQRKDGSDWVEAGAGTTTKAGYAQFTAPMTGNGGPRTYRVLAQPHFGFKASTSKGVSTAGWPTPDFSDEFSGGTLDATKWTHRMQGYLPDSHRKCSRPDPGAVTVAGGTARLQVIEDPARVPERCTRDDDGREFSYRLNANVGTEGKYTFQYGYAAARVRFQPLRGQHGSFWLQGGREIDVVEYFGDSHPSPLTSWVYDYATGTKVGAGGGSSGFIKDPSRFGKDWSGEYHVFSVEWTPDRYVFRIDGTQVWQTDELVSQGEQFLVMSLLSSDYYLQHMDESELPQTMHVDWIRVWER